MTSWSELVKQVIQVIDCQLVTCPHTELYSLDLEQPRGWPVLLNEWDAAATVVALLSPEQIGQVFASMAALDEKLSEEFEGSVVDGYSLSKAVREFLMEALRSQPEVLAAANPEREQRFAEAIGLPNWETYGNVKDNVLFELTDLAQLPAQILNYEHLASEEEVMTVVNYCQSQGHDPLDALPYQLGFFETPAMLEAKRSLVAALDYADREQQLRRWLTYQQLAEALIEALPDEGKAHARAQLGLMVTKALIWRHVGTPGRYQEELADAYTHAYHMGFDDVIPVLAEAQHRLGLTVV